MGVTLEQIGSWLDAKELKYDMDDKRIAIVAGDEDDTNAFFFQARENGELFHVSMRLVDDNQECINIKNHQYTTKVLEHILFANYETKFGTWEYDPSDGDIRLKVEIPLEDAIMTEKQFNRILGFLFHNAQEIAKEIKHIMKTGEAQSIRKTSNATDMFAALTAAFSNSTNNTEVNGI